MGRRKDSKKKKLHISNSGTGELRVRKPQAEQFILHFKQLKSHIYQVFTDQKNDDFTLLKQEVQRLGSQINNMPFTFNEKKTVREAAQHIAVIPSLILLDEIGTKLLQFLDIIKPLAERIGVAEAVMPIIDESQNTIRVVQEQNNLPIMSVDSSTDPGELIDLNISTEAEAALLQSIEGFSHRSGQIVQQLPIQQAVVSLHGVQEVVPEVTVNSVAVDATDAADAIDDVETTDIEDEINAADAIKDVETTDIEDEINAADAIEDVGTTDIEYAIDAADVIEVVGTTDIKDAIDAADSIEDVGTTDIEDDIDAADTVGETDAIDSAGATDVTNKTDVVDGLDVPDVTSADATNVADTPDVFEATNVADATDLTGYLEMVESGSTGTAGVNGSTDRNGPPGLTEHRDTAVITEITGEMNIIKELSEEAEPGDADVIGVTGENGEIGVTGVTDDKDEASEANKTNATGITENKTTIGGSLFYNSGTTQLVTASSPISFNQCSLQGLAFNGTTLITIVADGFYYFDWQVSLLAGQVAPSTFGIVVNGSHTSSVNMNSSSANAEVSGSAVINLAAGNTVQLYNLSSVSKEINASSTGAKLTIVRIDS